MSNLSKRAAGCGNYGTRRAGGSGAHQSDTVLALYFGQSGPRVCAVGVDGGLTDLGAWPIQGGYAVTESGQTVCLNDVCGLNMGHAYVLYGDLGVGPDLGLVGVGPMGHAAVLHPVAKTAAGCGGWLRAAGSSGASRVAGPFMTPFASAPMRPGASPADIGLAQSEMDQELYDPYNPFNEWDALQSESPPEPVWVQPPLLEEVHAEPDLAKYQTHHAGGDGFPVGETFPPVPRRRRAAGAGTPEQIAIVQRGILPAFQAGQLDPIIWSQIQVGDYQIMVTNEPLSVSGLRLPTSMEEEIVIANAIRALPITPAVSNERWRVATRGVPFGSGLTDPRGAVLNDPGQVIAWNQKYPNNGEFSDGFWKEGVIVPGLTERNKGALAQFGGRKNDQENSPTVQQGFPGDHNEKWKDYSNTPTYMGRTALKNGVSVDLLDELATGGQLGGPLPAWLVAKLRGTAVGS